jgi:hypothetical protein
MGGGNGDVVAVNPVGSTDDLVKKWVIYLQIMTLGYNFITMITTHPHVRKVKFEQPEDSTSASVVIETKLAGFPVESFAAGARFQISKEARLEMQHYVADIIDVPVRQISLTMGGHHIAPKLRRPKLGMPRAEQPPFETPTPLKMCFTYTPDSDEKTQEIARVHSNLKLCSENEDVVGRLCTFAREAITASVEQFKTEQGIDSFKIRS